MKKRLPEFFLQVLLLTFSFSASSQVLFTESFSGDTLPPGWTNDSLGNTAIHLWDFDNPYGRVITGANFDTHFAIFDSDQGLNNDSIPELASLTTPSIDISAANTTLFLEFDEQFKAFAFAATATRVIQMSIDNGVTWTLLDSTIQDIGIPDAVHTVFDISSVIPATNLFIRFKYTGNYEWWWAIDNVEVISRPACTAPPNAGSAQASLSSVCSTDSILLSLTGNDIAIGLSYQWQHSPDSITWTNITNDTLETTVVYQTASSYYRCLVSCSGQSSPSVVVLVSQNGPTLCYCIAGFTNCDALDKVTFHTLNNTGSGCNSNSNHYINYPDTGMLTTTVAPGIYDLTIASGAGSGNHGAGVWFDFNKNGNFDDPGEFFHISDSVPEFSPDVTIPVAIPAGPTGQVRMRVRYVYNNPVRDTSDCFNYFYGETEDYTITLSGGSNIIRTEMDKINVSPNPANDFIRVKFPDIPGEKHILFFDVTGRIIYSIVNSNNAEVLDLNGLSRGVYFLRIQSRSGSVVKNVVVQ